jgi:hypothetical protein
LYEGGESGGASRNPFGLSGQIDASTFPFPSHGNTRSLEFRDSRVISLKGGYESHLDFGDVAAQLRAGFEFSSFNLSRHYNSLPWSPNPFFDVYGEQALYYDTTRVGQTLRNYLAEPFSPYEGALYLSTRLDYKSIVFQPGIRLDFFSPVTMMPPEQRGRDADVANALASLPDASLKFQVSPRIGVSYPVTDKSQFRVNFSMMFKMPEFNILFDNAFGNAQRGNQIFGNPDIAPEKVINYEMGYEALVSDEFKLEVAAFYRDIFNESGVRFVPAVPSPYLMYTVQEFGNVRGIEFTLRKLLTNHLQGEISYALQRAVGTSSTPTSNYGLFTGGADPYTGEMRQVPLTEFPLSFDHTHNVNASVSIIYGKDEGPSVGGVKLFENGVATISGSFSSGLPYTRFNSRGQQIGEYNAERQPAQFGCDAHFERGFRLDGLMGKSVGDLELSLFVDIYNLFNITSPVAVYPTSGNPDNDGSTLERRIGDFTSTPMYATIDPTRPETFASTQYDRFGERLYNPYADSNLDGVETQQERFDGYARWVTAVQAQRPNYQAPRSVYAGFKVSF